VFLCFGKTEKKHNVFKRITAQLNNHKEYKFINTVDDSARLINNWANHLYQQIVVLDISDVDIDAFGKYYFTNHHHGNRLFFSIQSSADIIYKAVKKTDKKIPEITFLDYGAGLGTLFLLAGLLGFKKICYNDYFPQWVANAKAICHKLNIKVDDFIAGDIDAVIEYAKPRHIQFDIIASRNVVEHVYNLREFYAKLYQSEITPVCYATTTANYHNPVMRLKHYWYHHKLEKTLYIQQRTDFIQELVPGINRQYLDKLVKLTRGRAFADFTGSVNNYLKGESVQAVEFLSTNTCDCKTGVWAEHLLTRKNYFDIIEKTGFTAEYSAGFWDTHYKYALVNVFTRFLNRLIILIGKKGYWLSPFVNVIARKKQ
jgi:2-polyprenyl-3-methyl-5-hydroxy-6-metoxy-1,4-benzoquinol methylase